MILVVGFSLSFHILLTHMKQFSTPGHSILKTLIMMSGEYDYGDIFFPDRDDDGHGDTVQKRIHHNKFLTRLL